MKENSEKDQRRIRNFLLQPLLQVRLGLYTIILAAIFSSAVLTLLYYSLIDFGEIVMALTDSESEIKDLFDDYSASSTLWLYVLVLAFMICNILITVIYTHRLVGPSIAFRGQIQKLINGDFSGKVILRKDDAFQELATEINRLSQILKENNGCIKVPEKK
jgi:signal transduction histidine kinase